MKKVTLTLLTVLFLCFSCNANDTPIDEQEVQDEQTGEGSFIKDIDISSMIFEYPSEITDFDIEDGYLYYNYKFHIYRLDLSLEDPLPELIVNDLLSVTISSASVIGNTLYYQTYWGSSSDIKKVDLNNLSETPGKISSQERFRGKLVKKDGELIYLSSENVFSAITNFYQLNEASNDELIIADQASYPYYDNMKFVGDHLYFSSENEVRMINLNTPTQESTIIFTASPLENQEEGKIIGFDIKDDIIFYSRIGTNKLYSSNLNTPNEDPEVISTNTNQISDSTGYTELIINGDYLYAKKTA